MSTVEKFYRIHHDLVDPYSVALSGIISDMMALVEA